MKIEIMSFGFKYNDPPLANFVFDVRRVYNPHNIKELRKLDGRDQRVWDQVMRAKKGPETADTIVFALQVLFDGLLEKKDMTVAIGCFGGRHRSVVIARRVAFALQQRIPKAEVTLTHRELG